MYTDCGVEQQFSRLGCQERGKTMLHREELWAKVLKTEYEMYDLKREVQFYMVKPDILASDKRFERFNDVVNVLQSTIRTLEDLRDYDLSVAELPTNTK